jgi:hypothetical protein
VAGLFQTQPQALEFLPLDHAKAARGIAQRPPQLGGRPMTVEIDGARGRLVQTQEKLQEGGLAAARRPGDGDEATGLDVEAGGRHSEDRSIATAARTAAQASVNP